MQRPEEYLNVLTSDAVRKQPADSPAKRWFLLDGNRLVLATLVVIGIFAVFLSSFQLGIVGAQEEGPTDRLFHVLAVGSFTIIGLVITINQFVLSREFGSVEKLRERAEGIEEFRRDVEEATDTAVSPAQPTDFLRLLILTLRQRADAIEERTIEGDDGTLDERVEAYLDTVIEYTDQMDDILERTEFGTFNALSAMLNYTDAWQIHAARRICHERADSLSDDALEAFEDLIEVLELFGIARAYFKTLYMEQELAKLSRVLFYVGIPSLLVAGIGMLFYGAGGEPAIGAPYLPYVVSAMAAVAMAPLAVLFAYAIRIATVAIRTPSVGSFHTGHDRRMLESTE